MLPGEEASPRRYAEPEAAAPGDAYQLCRAERPTPWPCQGSPVAAARRRVRPPPGTRDCADHRTTRSVALSPAGAALLERAREILAAVDSAVDDARRAARGEYGRLAIGFTGSSTYAMLPSLAVALREELPGVV